MDFEAWMSSLNTRQRKLKNTMGHLSGDRCECGLSTMKLNILDYLCDDLKKFRCIQFLSAALYERFIDVLERAYHRNSMRRATRMPDERDSL